MPTDYSIAVQHAGSFRPAFGPNSLALVSARQARKVRTFMLVAVSVLFAGLVAGASGVFASPGGERMTPDEARMGTLLFKTTDPNSFVSAPMVGTDIDVQVSGATARGRITQHFQNPTDGWVEAVYVMPLPEDSAVDTMRMIVGQKVVLGDIKERAEARQIFEAAKAKGQKAALFSQERPNIFTHEVANIGPGETIVIQLEWQQAIAFDKARFAFRMPLVVAPRFNPKPILQTVDFDADGRGWGQVVDPVPDRTRIEPPVLDPAANAPANPVTLSVRLDAGFEIGDIVSHHHQVVIAPLGSGEGNDVAEEDGARRLVTLAAGAAPADRDFELTWTAKSGTTPSVGLFRETVAGEDYVVAFVTPPDAQRDIAPGAGGGAEAVRPREMIFVIDNSGSMGGESIRQARQSLLHGLDRLKPVDSFNVIRFDDTFDTLFARAVPASSDNVAKAKAFVSGLEASGGTMMVAPMQAALADAGHPANRSALRQVVFLTDGAIGNEAQLMDLVAAHRGRARVFMVGIGSAPNSYLMSRISEIGRGTFMHIGSVDEVRGRMTALFEKLESPAVTDLRLTLDGVGGDFTPEGLPDLYRGEPLVIAGRVDGKGGSVSIAGRIGDTPWQVTLPLDKARAATGVSKLWARRKIRDAEIAARLGKKPQDEVDTTVLRLAIDHHLVSRLTSLVAVEKAISRPDGAPLTRADIPLNLPKGWDFEKVFGPRGGDVGERAEAGGGAGARLEKVAAAGDGAASGDVVGDEADAPADRTMLVAPVTATQAAQQGRSRFASVSKSAGPVAGLMSLQSQPAQHVMLPGTATDAELRIYAGVLLVLLGMLSLAWLSRARFAGRRHAR